MKGRSNNYLSRCYRVIMSEQNSGLGHIWKTMPLVMKILFVTVDLGVLFAALYYFGFA